MILEVEKRKRTTKRALFAAIYNWFTEGFATADPKDATALLEELRIWPDRVAARTSAPAHRSLPETGRESGREIYRKPIAIRLIRLNDSSISI